MSSSSDDTSSQPSGPLPLSLDRSDERLRFLGHLRQIAAEARTLLGDLRTLKSVLTTPNYNLDEIAQNWRDVEMKIYQGNSANVNDLFAKIKTQMEANPSLLDHDGDTVTTIENIWDRLDPKWPRFPETGNPDVRILLSRIDGACALLIDVICHAAMLTMPNRLNDLLRELRVGQTIDFNAEFADEIPDPAGRQLALQYLYRHPLIVLGVVDVEHGLIYRASSNMLQRRLSPVYITLLAILGGAIVYLSYPILPSLPNVPSNALNLLLAYICIMAGGFAHTAVDSIKQYRASKDQSFTALGDLMLWIHVKQFPIIVSILTLWVVFIGLIVTGLGKDWQAALFVGYSFDSFFDIFLQRFAVAASARTASIQSPAMSSPKTATA